MLRTVIAEHALDVLHAADQPYVEHENSHAHDAVYDVPSKRVTVILPHDEVGYERRDDNEKHHAEH